MNQRVLQEQLHSLEEASQRALGYTPTCLRAASAAAEVGDLDSCLMIVDGAIPVFSQADLPDISAPLIGVHNGLAYHPTAA